MMKRRRCLGVAAFAYALVHTALYLVDEGAAAFMKIEISKLYIWTGWLAFLIFVPLAVTSTDGWVRKLGHRWKTLQRFVYAAAVLTLLHWAALHDWGGIGAAMVHFGPLIGLEAYRLGYNLHRQRRRMA
jgi:sulfoxide reductase heme-binding subunit YedZ